jgi:antitoxin component YwqK of YwqJK toxin-antitoxin module
MNTPKIIVGLLTIFIASATYYFLTKKEPEPPPNERVVEGIFAQLRSEMTEDQVESLLGSPHKKMGGDIVRIDLADSPDPKYAIEEQPLTEGGNPLNFYQGRNKESIVVLFSGRKGTVAAVEYRIGDYPVLYRGPRIAKRTAPMRMTSQGRVAGTDQEQEQRELLAQYERRKELEKNFVAGSFVTSQESAAKPADPPPQPSSIASAAGASVQPSPPVGSLASLPTSPSPESLKPAPAASAPSVSASPATPVAPAPARTNSVPSKGQPLKITLPSGKMLTDATLALGASASWQGGGLSGGAASYQETHPSGSVRGRYSVSKGKLNGPATTYYENNSVESMASYMDGQLHDVLSVWDEKHERLLYAKYTRDNKDGIVCLFRSKWPWLVQEWSKGALQHEYLVRYVDENADVLDAAKLEEGTDDETDCSEARRQLDDLQKRLLRNAKDVKQKVIEDFRKEQKKAKQAKDSSAPATRNGRP